MRESADRTPAGVGHKVVLSGEPQFATRDAPLPTISTRGSRLPLPNLSSQKVLRIQIWRITNAHP
jgi:hypothetical protein